MFVWILVCNSSRNFSIFKWRFQNLEEKIVGEDLLQQDKIYILE